MGLTAGNIAGGGRVQRINAMDDHPIPLRVGDVVESDDGRRGVVIGIGLDAVEVVLLQWGQEAVWLPRATVRRARHRTPVLVGSGLMPDPFGIQLKCPTCGQQLTYQYSQGDTHYYRCSTHGRLVLPPSGIIQMDDPDDSAVRH